MVVYLYVKILFKYLGWGQLFKFKTSRGTVTSVGSATPAILMVLVAFGLPSQFQFWPFQVKILF